MIFSPLSLAGTWTIDLDRHADERGFFARTFDLALLEGAGMVSAYPQHSVAFNSAAGTVRGMHFTYAPYEETKIVRCTRGAVFDVIVDIRPQSATFRSAVGIELSAENGRALYIPAGCAHGYQTLADASEVLYLITPPYVTGYAGGLRYNDPLLGIAWPLPVTIISERDLAWPLLA